LVRGKAPVVANGGINMTIEEIKKKIKSDEYDFLRNSDRLQDNIILLGLGGSYAYGTNTESSDVDVRGIALNSKSDILGLDKGFEQFTDIETDTVIYAFNKMIKLLAGCNPNVIEILGLKQDHYLYLSPIGKELLDNKHLFISKKAAFTFGAYAYSQLRRLDNKAARLVSQTEQERHILNSIENASYDFKTRYFAYDDDAIKLYIDKSESEEYDSEIFMDVNLKHYPLRDYKGMWSVMNNIVKEYSKIGKRNQNAIEHNKLAKHMMHLVRLYLMCLDILDNGEIVTYREKDHDFLMDIRNGKYLDENRQPIPEFFDIVDELEARLDRAKQTTALQDNPDYNKINEFVASVNERIVKGEI
jgi:predicted nucleotidyltransferase